MGIFSQLTLIPKGLHRTEAAEGETAVPKPRKKLLLKGQLAKNTNSSALSHKAVEAQAGFAPMAAALCCARLCCACCSREHSSGAGSRQALTQGEHRSGYPESQGQGAGPGAGTGARGKKWRDQQTRNSRRKGQEGVSSGRVVRVLATAVGSPLGGPRCARFCHQRLRQTCGGQRGSRKPH